MPNRSRDLQIVEMANQVMGFLLLRYIHYAPPCHATQHTATTRMIPCHVQRDLEQTKQCRAEWSRFALHGVACHGTTLQRSHYTIQHQQPSAGPCGAVQCGVVVWSVLWRSAA